MNNFFPKLRDLRNTIIYKYLTNSDKKTPIVISPLSFRVFDTLMEADITFGSEFMLPTPDGFVSDEMFSTPVLDETEKKEVEDFCSFLVERDTDKENMSDMIYSMKFNIKIPCNEADKTKDVVLSIDFACQETSNDVHVLVSCSDNNTLYKMWSYMEFLYIVKRLHNLLYHIKTIHNDTCYDTDEHGNPDNISFKTTTLMVAGFKVESDELHIIKEYVNNNINNFKNWGESES